jgi:hypothetical protein
MNATVFDPMIGREFIGRVRELARHSDSATHYTRTYLTSAHRDASRRIAQWMREAGMSVRRPIGKRDRALRGRGAGGVSHNPAETVSEDDAAAAIAALLDFLRHFRI